MYYSFKRRHTRFNFSNWLAEQQVLILLVILFAAGVISGSLYVANEKGMFLTEILKLFKECYIVRTESSFLQLFFRSLQSELLFFIPAFLFGTCALGAPAIFCISFLRGLGLGILTSVIYQNYGLTGLGYNVFILIPGAVLGSAALIFACKEGYYMSLDMFGKLFQNRRSGKRKNNIITFKIYCARFGIFLLFVISSAFVDGVTSGVFGPFFKLL